MRTAVFVCVATVVLLLPTPARGDLNRLIEDLFSPDAMVRAAARDGLIATGGLRVAPALVDMVFFNSNGRTETVAVLEHLLGERHGASYKKWVETIGRREEIIPLPGYVTLKARLLGKIDPAFSRLLREDSPRSIRVEEVVSGGVRKDGIPALDKPKMIPASRAAWLLPDEIVFGVSINGDTRAYPERILAWHEMANDVVGGRPVSLSYCTLCGAAILYDGRASDRRAYTFGSSGLLYRSNKLMYDRQTETLWSQLTGEPVIGPLVARRLEPLRVLPLAVTTWREWLAMHPQTRVLSLETGFQRDYRPGAAYGKYFASADLMFPVWKKAPPDLEAKEWVFVVNVGEARKIYAIDDLQRAPLVHDRIGDRDIVIVSERAYSSGGRSFRRDGAVLLDATTGEQFAIAEEELVGSSGTRLPRIASHRAFWFGAWAFYPGAELWEPK